MSKNKEVNSTGIGLMGVMFLIMFAGKMFGWTSISWWIVTAPIWGPLLVVLVFFAIAAVIVWRAEKQQ